MTTKCFFLCIFFSTIIMVCVGQVAEKKDSTFFFDADSTLLGVFYKSNETVDSTIYWDLQKKRISVTFDVPRYKFGNDSLNKLLLKQFRERLNFVEVDGAALVYILLDGCKIKEIRIGKRIGYNRKYDDIIKESLMITNEDWIFPEKKEKPLLFVYLLKMK